MLKDLNPTTRCYPRRSEDAFPDPVANSQWWYPPERSMHTRHIVLGCIGIVMWIGVGIFLLKG